MEPQARTGRKGEQLKYEAAQFLNVDLDLASRARLDDLLAAFGKRVIVLHHDRIRDRWQAVLELSPQPRTAEDAIRRFVRLIEDLPSSARRQWDRASLRSFNIGIQSGMEGRAFELKIGPRVLGDAARIDARIAVTVYPPMGVRRQSPRSSVE